MPRNPAWKPGNPGKRGWAMATALEAGGWGSCGAAGSVLFVQFKTVGMLKELAVVGVNGDVRPWSYISE